jgi:DNA invertase Pin-like site-specific DNA recombinase
MVLDGYVRVSQVRGREGESFISPADQRQTIERWIAMRSATVGVMFEELDESGARDDRPLLSKAVARVESGQSEGLVVSELDRFGRSLLHGLATIERIRKAGGTFASVNNGFDLSTDNGRLVLHIMLSLAEWDLDRIRSRWRTAQSYAVARGVHMGGRPPAGYVHDERRRLHPHPRHGPAVTKAFGMRARGATLTEVSRFLAKVRVPTAYGSLTWSLTALRGLFRNRVYLGQISHGDLLLEDAHTALVDPLTWHLAQAPRRRVVTPHGQPAVLAGLVRCAGCRTTMHTTPLIRNGRRHRAYSCRRDDCDSRAYIAGSVVEPYVEAAFFALVEKSRSPAELELLEREVRGAHDALVAYRDDPAILEALGPEDFADGLAVRARRQRQAVAALADARDALDVLEPGGRDHWERRWETMSVLERREAMARLIDEVMVSRGAAPVAQRVAIRARDSGEAVDVGPSTARWEDARIEAELREFASEAWPSDDEFIAAGRGPLLREVNATGGPPRWAGVIGAHGSIRRARGYWTEDRVRAALAVLLADRRTWPSRRGLAAVGYAGLCGAMDRRGHAAWASEFGFQARSRHTGVRWSEQTIARALGELCRGRATYPSHVDFQTAGQDGLFQAIRSRHGGHERWARRVGLPRANHRPSVATVRRWSDELVDERLRQLIADLGLQRYPLVREFYAAGQGGLHRRIKATQGHAWWARRLELPRPTTGEGLDPAPRPLSRTGR